MARIWQVSHKNQSEAVCTVCKQLCRGLFKVKSLLSLPLFKSPLQNVNKHGEQSLGTLAVPECVQNLVHLSQIKIPWLSLTLDKKYRNSLTFQKEYKLLHSDLRNKGFIGLDWFLSGGNPALWFSHYKPLLVRIEQIPTVESGNVCSFVWIGQNDWSCVGIWLKRPINACLSLNYPSGKTQIAWVNMDISSLI